VWGISLAILDENLSPVAGILFYPPMDKWYVAFRQSGRPVRFSVTFDDGRPELKVDEKALARAVPPDGFRMEDAYLYSGSSPRILDMGKVPCKIRALGCTSFHIAALADGEADPVAAALHGYKVYDIAAALVIAAACGLSIFDIVDSEFVPFEKLIAFPRRKLDCRPLLVGHRSALSQLKDKVRPRSPAG
jgi:fructose-1,6-bisphosphatase/inositol monophosphatase family enzyme